MEQRRAKTLVQEKSFRFAVNVVEYAHRHQKNYINPMLTSQLLRSGTSIRANIDDALRGQSRKDFIAKLVIAAKEALETGYWLRLIRETQPHNIQELDCLLTDCDVLKAMLNSIISTNRSTLATADSLTHLRTPNSESRTHNPESPVS